jgi:uncharacterized protein YbjQ (UPF0145 family)
MAAPATRSSGLNVPPPESVVGAIDQLELGGQPKAVATQAPPVKPAAPAAPAANTPMPPAAPKPAATAGQNQAVLKSAAPVAAPAAPKPDATAAPAAPPATGAVSKPENSVSSAVMSMPVTTGQEVPGRHMLKVVGVVSSQVLVRVGNDPLPKGGPVQTLAGTDAGNHMQQGVEQACMALRAQAAKISGDAVVATQVSYCAGVGGGMLIAVTGTAVKLAPSG